MEQSGQESGLSGIAITVIVILIIIGGIVVISQTSDNQPADQPNTQQTTSTPDTDTADSNPEAETDSENGSSDTVTTNFSCDDDQTIALALTQGGQAELTLPSGDSVMVAREEVDGQTQFESEDGSLVFRNTGEGAVLEQGGEVLASGCTAGNSGSGN